MQPRTWKRSTRGWRVYEAWWHCTQDGRGHSRLDEANEALPFAAWRCRGGQKLASVDAKHAAVQHSLGSVRKSTCVVRAQKHTPRRKHRRKDLRLCKIHPPRAISGGMEHLRNIQTIGRCSTRRSRGQAAQCWRGRRPRLLRTSLVDRYRSRRGTYRYTSKRSRSIEPRACVLLSVPRTPRPPLIRYLLDVAMQ